MHLNWCISSQKIILPGSALCNNLYGIEAYTSPWAVKYSSIGNCLIPLITLRAPTRHGKTQDSKTSNSKTLSLFIGNVHWKWSCKILALFYMIKMIKRQTKRRYCAVKVRKLQTYSGNRQELFWCGLETTFFRIYFLFGCFLLWLFAFHLCTPHKNNTSE